MNKVTLKFKSRMENEAFARIAAVSFLSPLNPTFEEMMEIKTIVSEAVTNAILHGYESNPNKTVKLEIGYDKNRCVTMIISDSGCGISDINQAIQPLFTTKQELERSGMGMTIMQSFSDSFDVISSLQEGTSIVVQKKLRESE